MSNKRIQLTIRITKHSVKQDKLCYPFECNILYYLFFEAEIFSQNNKILAFPKASAIRTFEGSMDLR